MQGKIHILTGISQMGGSTVAHINLCNLFNSRGLDCTLYGPHDWPQGKCKFDYLENVQVHSDDTVIAHFIGLQNVAACRKLILSCHETNLYPINQLIEEGKLNPEIFSGFHFVSEFQRDWQRNHLTTIDKVATFVIPNIIDQTLIPSITPHKTTAGVVGSLDPHKQVHVSIDRALADGHDKVLIFGCVSDGTYFIKEILPRLSEKVCYCGTKDNKQDIYDNLSIVYHSSIRETFNYIKAECEATNTLYNGLESSESNAEYGSVDEIFDAWMEVLK